MALLNYDDARAQLQAAGLLVDKPDIGIKRRCRVQDGGREKRGWYHLHELMLKGGDSVIVGVFGYSFGDTHHVHKVDWKKDLPKPDAVQSAALRARIREDMARAEAERKRTAARAADRAARVWERCAPAGEHDYLTRKAIKPYGVRFSPGGALAIPMHDALGRIHHEADFHPADLLHVPQ